MSTETLTSEERENMANAAGGWRTQAKDCAKALRIIDALIAENERLERQLEEAHWNAMGEDL